MSGIKNWWSSVSRFPSWGDDLRHFMEATIGATVNLAFAKAKRPAIVWDEATTTAFADPKKNVIGISAKMLSPNKAERLNPLASKEESMAATMGFMVHEIAHFLFTPPSLADLVESSIPFNALSRNIANLLEDIFIEKEIERYEKSFGWMIAAAWDYMFTDSEIKSRLAKWDGNSGGELDNILNVMIGWKHRLYDFEMRSDFEEELYDLCMEVSNMRNVEDRRKQITKVYNFLVNNSAKNSSENQESSSSEQGEGEEGSGEGSAPGKQENKNQGDSGKASSGDDKGGKEAGEKGEGELMKPVGKEEMTRLAPNMEKGTISNAPHAHDIARHSRAFEVDVVGNCQVVFKRVTPGSGKLSYDRKWLKFGELALDRGTARHVRGEPGFNGRLTHPSRFFDDGKVFSQQQVKAPNGFIGFGSPQTAILIDFSGSMTGYVNGTNIEKFAMACQVAAGMLDGFAKAGHRVSVYGHTTGSDCDVYVLKRFEESVELGHKNLVGASSVSKSGNTDHAAIEAVGSKFVMDGSPCRLFVISDGSPASMFYRNDNNGIEMTAASVTKLRKKGIEVYSFSIDEDAIAPNNIIYGKKSNFYCHSESVVRQFVSSLV
jgi:hypothetical protein